MTNINSGGFVPQRSFQQFPRPSGQPQSDLPSQSKPQQAPVKDTAGPGPVLEAGPSETTLATQKQQQLTSPATQNLLHQQIMQAAIRPPKERPALSILKRSSMSLLLAETLGAYNEEEDDEQDESEED